MHDLKALPMSKEEVHTDFQKNADVRFAGISVGIAAFFLCAALLSFLFGG